MTSTSHLRVGMLNVRGLAHTAQELEDWIQHDRLNITAVSEILLTPGAHPGLSLDHEILCGPEKANGRGTKGGVAIILYGVAKHKVVLRLREDYAQAIGVKIRDVTYVSTYIRPDTKRDDIKNFLTKIHRACVGTTLILGDLNARRREWCTIDTTAGNAITDWCETNGWHIDAPPIPTRQDARVLTTVDLALSRNCKLSNYKHASRYCLGISDHIPVYGTLDKENRRDDEETQRITLNRRLRTDFQKETLERMIAELPALCTEIEKVFTQEELNIIYRKYKEIMIAAYVPKGRRRNRRRFKYFWPDALNFRARIRSRLYKKAKRTGLEADQRNYEQYARML